MNRTGLRQHGSTLALRIGIPLAVLSVMIWITSYFIGFRVKSPLTQETSYEIAVWNGTLVFEWGLSDEYRFGDVHWEFETLSGGGINLLGLIPGFAMHAGQNMYSWVLWIPMWMVSGMIAAPPVYVLRRRRQKRHLPGHCRQCGYDLTGTLAAGRTDCPECGAAASE